MKINNPLKLIIAVVVSELAGIIGSVFTTPSIAGWYAGIAKPAFNPPAWVFGPVWTTLFALMGIAAFLVWKQGLDRKDVKIALGIFLGQLVLNTLWSIIFFGSHSLAGAFVELIILWLAILATIIAFAKISKPAAWLLVPYILWVSFAGFLNYSIWQLNKTPGSGGVACTAEAKLCPDGSYVGRTGPNCEFASCPSNTGVRGGVAGKVTLGPICPVMRIPPDPACADKGYQTTVVAKLAGTNTEVGRMDTNLDGDFNLPLPPGEYDVTALGKSPFPTCRSQSARVEEGVTTALELTCDTGIR